MATAIKASVTSFGTWASCEIWRMVDASSVTVRVASGIMRVCFRRYDCASAAVEESGIVVSDFSPVRGGPGVGEGGVGGGSYYL